MTEVWLVLRTLQLVPNRTLRPNTASSALSDCPLEACEHLAHLAVVIRYIYYLIMQALVHLFVGVVHLLGCTCLPKPCASDPPEEHSYAPRRHQPL